MHFLAESIHYPDDLPISARRDEIARALSAHQVLIVSGETGSGKTTQLPKICLGLGRGQKQLIGHTQPRRLAAQAVAQRLADELKTPLGEGVGYQVRFREHLGPKTAIKLMTDGILLVEIQQDPLLRRYDTLIIDEAHERSLNIDFLLGYIKQLLPRRPDLKVMITSATIDAKRFAQHFASAPTRPAPIIEVSGRLYPVEICYVPLQSERRLTATTTAKTTTNTKITTNTTATAAGQERTGEAGSSDRTDLMAAIVGAVHKCIQHGPGDILIFLPGEREIREAAGALRTPFAVGTELLALYARLSPAEQGRIFQPTSSVRRIVLATNVAETSLTVPGIRFVVDTGLARIKRYSWRNKVEQLRIEPVSRASAHQRSGRCGRIGPGFCVRLYDETDFNARPAFTDPEILRCSLASVILRMKSLKLGNIEDFPFIDPPPKRAITDGYHLLQELGAITAMEEGELALTPVGIELARLPVDARIGRMILGARAHHCLAEMLIIAAALSVQDPRTEPMESKEAAHNAHAKFFDERSEFLFWVKLWQWYHSQRQQKLSQRKLGALLRQNFLSPARIREWCDVHAQLARIVQEQGWRVNQSAATFEQIHQALLTGLLGNIGIKNEERGFYQGTHDIRFYIHPSSRLNKKAGRIIVAAEQVETTRLYARCVARIELVWIERAAAHLLRYTWSEPRWEKKAQQVVANERATLYGLTIYTGRRVHYGRINPQHAREIFIRAALVEGEIDAPLPFLVHNRRLIADIEKLEQRARRCDILVDDAHIYAFYDKQIPADMSQAATLEKWYAGLDQAHAQALRLTRDLLMRHEAASITPEIFPKQIHWQGVKMALDYHFEPGSPRDGVTLFVPIFVLNQLDAQRWEWLVPGMLKEKVQGLLKSLPQKMRRACAPLPDYAAAFHARWFDRLNNPQQGLLDALAADMWEQVKVRPALSDFKLETLPRHLFMNFHIVDEHQRVLAVGRNLAQLKAEHGRQAGENFQEVAAQDRQGEQIFKQTGLTTWSVGDLPEMMEITRQGQTVIGYPALIDRGTHCDVEVLDDPEEARKQHRVGLLRLFRLALREPIKFQEKNLPDWARISLLFMPLGTQDALRDQIIESALARACLGESQALGESFIYDAATFSAQCAGGRDRLGLLAQEITRHVGVILTEWTALQRKLPQAKSYRAAYQDLQQQVAALMVTNFLRDTPAAHLAHYPRYLQAAAMRIDKLRADPQRDQRLMTEMMPLLAQYQRARVALKGKTDARLDEFRWLLEELRVALFAQPLRTPMPVSVKRLSKAWAQLR